MVRELLVRLKSKTIAAVLVTSMSVAGVVLGAVWHVSEDRAGIDHSLEAHDTRLTDLEDERLPEVEQTVSSQDERIRQVEAAITRIDSNVAWLREDAERQASSHGDR